ncbi:MAG: hypothetical protein R3336_02130 [Phycisphaeraceae bacterium]|nr:hypothetical protein [Phycisphaeraceae bacterium]
MLRRPSSLLAPLSLPAFLAALALLMLPPGSLRADDERLADPPPATEEATAESQEEQDRDPRPVWKRIETTCLESVDLDERPLRQALKWWASIVDVPQMDTWRDLKRHGVDPNQPITVQLKKVPARVALDTILGQVEAEEALVWEANPWYVRIDPVSTANRRQDVILYDTAALLHAPIVPGRPASLSLTDVLEISGAENPATLTGDYAGTRELADVVRDTIFPDLWSERGGDEASARVYRGHLVVRAPRYVHDQIGGLKDGMTGYVPVGP